MSLRCFRSSILPIIITEKHCPIRKPVSGVILMISHNSNHSPLHNTRSLSFKNKVFEDESKGIICYRDDKNGEIICEGYDEGPRVLHQNFATLSSNPRDNTEEIIDLLQRIWLLNG